MDRPREDPGAKEMSREGDDGMGDVMGDVIRKAAAPAGEGSYKKVRDKKELFSATSGGTGLNVPNTLPRDMGFECQSRGVTGDI